MATRFAAEIRTRFVATRFEAEMKTRFVATRSAAGLKTHFVNLFRSGLKKVVSWQLVS